MLFQDRSFISLLKLSNILTQYSVRIINVLGVAGPIPAHGDAVSPGRYVWLVAVIAGVLQGSGEQV
ncbi:hypothetical protein [Enterobacter quasiroggenkampii]|uniref:hypothetical protein n=1 Tax=Enterobacter quasiroggenkampii TaxID=2497436 RepID=UPI003F669341|nr:hypothetical protein [Enterobacter quasiroggenkampii]